ncbi:filopodin, putative [Entamoeba histolytica HM-1:IMSS]|uniref:Filopodin, putative n=1 Tax=Entamoeba histolytica (strain ATCC 30459 / HM-1:IMSS / ABRM) TaxID=294381 RepID=C4M9P2_ENTH1|nr:filopodin, putative [Entamoeba histolytica HM-1:IMSS]EAL48917.2 filopodin, putative [Entamoeba histolytica HM-1:IMSS]|eukprot:XP_654303.2 filopodin, putative [Entamoeba histolytica HM-1:IMSS]
MLSTKKMQFNFTATVYDILVAIKERQQSEVNMEEYALFLPNDKTREKGQWMIPKRTIESYDLVTDDEVWFRKRMQVVNVLLPDGSTKKMMLDVCQTIKGLVVAIADKLSLHHAEAFGIQIQGSNKFLRMKSSLYEVAGPSDVITLKKRHFIQEGELNKEDPMLLHLSYIQAHDNIVGGLYPCNKDEIIRFGALNAMIDIGKCDETKKVSTIHQNITHFAPEMYQKKEIEKEIFAKWKTMNSMTPVDAKYKYLQLCMTLRSYGMNIYHGGIEPKGIIQSTDPKKKKLNQVLMAFSPVELKMLTLDHKVIMSEPYEHLKSWKFSSEAVIFDFGKFNNGEIIKFYTSEGEDIFSLVAGYIEIITLKAQKVVEDDKDLEKATEVQLTKQKKTAAVKSTVTKTRVVAQPTPLTQISQSVESNDIYQANKTYALPVNFAVNLKEKTQSNDDNWRNQLRNQSDNLLGLLKPLSESFRNGPKLSNEKIKQFGFYVDGVRQAVLNGSSSVEDKEIFEAMANNLMDAINEYMDICSALEKDPNNPALLAALTEAERRIQMCTEALNACANGLVMDIDQDLIFELSQSVSADVDAACEIARAAAGDIVEAAISQAQTDARMLVFGAQSMGLAMGNPECQSIMNDLLSKCKNSSISLLETSQLKGTPQGGPLEEDIDDICKNCDLMDNFIEEIKDDKINKRKKFLESAGGCLQMADWLSTLQNMRVEDVQRAALEMKKDIPTIVKYMKESTASVEVDDAKRAFIIGNLKDMTSNAKIILTNADQTVYSPNKNDDIREAAGLTADAIKAVLGDDVNEVVHHSMYTDSKKAAIASLKMSQLLKAKSKNEKNAKYADQILNAARTASLITSKLLEPVEDDEDERKFMEKSLAIANEYDPFSKSIDGLVDQLEEGRGDIIEDKMQLDLMMAKLEQDVNTFQREDMLSSLHTAGMDYRMAAVELKREILVVDSANELEESGIKEELNEEALKALEEFTQARHQLDNISAFDYTTQAKVEDVAEKSKKVLKALIKASRTSKKKNERKMLLDAAMKLSNEMARMLSAVDEESIGNQINMKGIDADLVNAEKQITNILKIDDLVDIDLGKAMTVEITSEEMEAENTALTKMQTVTSEIDSIYKDMQKDIQAKKEAAEASEDPKQIVEATLQEAVLVMVGSSIGVLSTATTAQAELIQQLQNSETASGVHRDKEYAEELIKAVEDVKSTAIELQQKIKEDNVNSDELVKVADKVGKKVEKVVVSCRAGTRTKGRSHKYKDLLDASKKLADATKNLLECAKKVDEFDDTPVVVQMNLPPPPPPVTEVEEEEDIETFGIDQYTLKEIEQQKKIFELEKKLEAAKKKKADLEELAKSFQN